MTATVSLTAGERYPLVIGLADGSGTAKLSLRWSRATMLPESVIPGTSSTRDGTPRRIPFALLEGLRETSGMGTPPLDRRAGGRLRRSEIGTGVGTVPDGWAPGRPAGVRASGPRRCRDRLRAVSY